MDFRLVLIELAEKIGLLATAGLFTVMVKPLRGRLLGVGRPRDRVVAVIFGVALSLWGAKLGQVWLGYHVNIRAIGVLIAAILGGSRAGATAGLLAGLFYVFRVEPDAGVWGVLSSVLDGLIAGLIVERLPRAFVGWRALPTALGVQVAEGILVLSAELISGSPNPNLHAWPAIFVQALGSAAGLTLFVLVARLVLSREEAAVQLVEARAAADAFALSALRSRLEPHFLFNALNTLRATIRKDPERARALVDNLADLYRYLLNHPEDARLAEEVEHACSYLAIEEARLEPGRLEVKLEIEPEAGEAEVPALLLQPLVENAVKHGVAAHDGPGQVLMRAERVGSTLRIAVENHHQGRHLGAPSRGSGIALATLRERLAKRFGDRASLELQPLPDGMCACVEMPWPGVSDAKTIDTGQRTPGGEP
ncbi:MAG: hypothetical protein GXP55_18650 [Deltaproteobacteria bacterium]|nr:hypothetical protein [Deltaproteobacteria bacterium]